MHDDLCRCSTISTPHGDIKTPALIPVVAASYGIWDRWMDGASPAPWDLSQSVLLSLYHILPYRHKESAFTDGIHKTLGTKKPVWIDSGGFQYMKKGVELDPLEVLDYQRRSGCDISVTFDYPITPGLSADEKSERLQKSIDAANLMLGHNDGRMLYGAVHGSTPDEITAYASQLGEGFSGFGIGSLVPRKASYAHLVDIIHAVRSKTDAPLHAFGITGFPALFALAYLGVDTFDSWTYVVAAAYKEYVDPVTLSRIKNLTQRDSLPECTCSICQEYGLKDFLEPTSEGEMLLALHNLNVFLDEMRAVREAIGDGALENYIIQRGTGGNRNILKAFDLAKKKVREGR